MRRPPLLLAGFLVAATGACYTYSETPGDRVPDAGEVVRVRLTEQGARALRSRIGDERRVFGRIQRSTADSVTLSVRASTGDRIDALGAVRDSLTLAISSVDGWRRQEFSALRTAGVVLGVAGAAVLTTEVLVSGGGGGGGDEFLDEGGSEGAIGPGSSSSLGTTTLFPAAPVSPGWSIPIP